MNLSVIICTYNRSQSLIRTLQSLEGQDSPNYFTWEIVVVDNNSTDDTPEVVRDFANQTSLEVQYVREEKQGLAHAKNRGIAVARSEYIVFIDDDIRVCKNWLQAIYRTFKTYNCDAVGGKIHLELNAELPRWMKTDMLAFLGYQDFGNEVVELDGKNRYPHGGNMAFSRTVFDRIGLFDTSVGRKGLKLTKGSETEFFLRLSSVDSKIIYQPEALVYHKVVRIQLTKRYFRTIHFLTGKQKGYRDDHYYKRTFLGAPLFLYPQLARSMKKYIHLLAKGNPANSFRQQMTVCHFLGMMQGYSKRHLESRKDSKQI